jgi:hypothetical protein
MEIILMENYELYIEPQIKRVNPLNGQFLKGHEPFNKGIPQRQWLDGRKIKRINKYLDIGRKIGNPELPIVNSKKIVGIKDGKVIAFRNARIAAEYIKSLGIRINRRNISDVCHGKTHKIGKYTYVRKRAGGYQWFFAEDIERYKDFLT